MQHRIPCIENKEEKERVIENDMLKTDMDHKLESVLTWPAYLL